MKNYFRFSIAIFFVFAVLSAHSQNVIIRSPIQVFGHEEGAITYHPGEPWKVVTKTNYTPIEAFIGDAIPAGFVREYYLVIKKADNFPGCGNIRLRFSFAWTQPILTGVEVQTFVDWGHPTDGSVVWIRVPSIAEQRILMGQEANPNWAPYWRVEVKAADACAGMPWLTGRISSISVAAVDRVADASTPPPVYTVNHDPIARPGVYGLGGIGNSIFADDSSGFVGIGTEKPRSTLAVNGTLQARKVKVTVANAEWPDYVFLDNYQLPDLEAAIAYAREHKHLEGIPAAATIEKEGQDLGNMNLLLLKKIEELTLYLGDQKRTNDLLLKRVEELEKEIKVLKDK